MKNRSINILIVALVLLSAFSVAIVLFLYDAHDEFADRVVVKEDGVTETLVEVRDLMLVPTESKEYTVDFFCAASGDYEFEIEYNEIDDGGMKEFVIVTIKFDEEIIYSGLLSELLDTDTVVEFVGNLTDSDPTTVLFSYEMPYETGNEAQGTWSDFNIVFSVKKQ